MKVKLIIISIILLLVVVFACGCIPVMEKLGLVNPTNEEQLSPEKGGPPDGLVKVLIGFKEKPGPPEQALVKGLGGKIKYTYNFIPAMAASLPEKAIEALQKNPNVKYVEPDGLVQALDELDSSWGVKHIGAGVVHDLGNRGTGVKVAIIDTGIDSSHGDLTVVGGKSFVSYTEDFDDDNGHGTHVAGIVAALDDGIGVVGVAPAAELYALKALDENGSGYVSDVAYAIQWATVNEIQVINMSLGGGASITLEAACWLAYYYDGLLLVASAGNSGNPSGKGDNISYPAGYDSVIAVAATDQSDERARWSSTGPAVELAAPGVSIYSTYIGGYTTLSGTSMASPHVAGTAALVWKANPTWSNDDVRTQLQETAEDLGAVGWDSEFGYGLVNAAEAVGVDTLPPNDPPTVSITNPADGSTFNSGDAISFTGTAIDLEDGDLTANLDWTSSIDGIIGKGGNFFTNFLSDGIHTITTEVTDSGSNIGSASIGITVSTPITDDILHIKSIDMSLKKAGPNVNAIAEVTILDESDSPVEVATVSGFWIGATNDIKSGVTGTDGKVSFKSNRVKNPETGTTFTFTVDDVIKDGYTPLIDVGMSSSITFPEE